MPFPIRPLLAATAFILTACQSRPLRVDEAASNSTVTVPMGHTLKVALSENASTGYQWWVVADGSPTLRFLDSDYASDFAPPGMVGVGGTKTFSFTSCQPGTGKILLVSSRSPVGQCPSDMPDHRVFNLQVVVPDPAKTQSQ